MIWQTYVVFMVLASIVTFAMYGWDKRQAKLDGWRVPEKRLHFFAMIGGWPGAFAGQQFFRHKTSKPMFVIITWLAAIVHITTVVAAIVL